MQNRYVGDIGDFGKYGLLRAVFGSPESEASGCGLRLGVAWYLCPDESHNADGKFTGYLEDRGNNHKKFQDCDPVLYDKLRRLVAGGKRNVAAIRESGILPANTLYHEESLADAIRDVWLNGALHDTRMAEAVFVDPDNGISANAASPKHAAIDELGSFYHRGQSLIIYHHTGRRGTAEEQITRLSDCLRRELGPSGPIWALRYRRGSSRVYFIVAQKGHKPAIEKQMTAFRANALWFERRPGLQHPHFELVETTQVC